MIPILAGLLFAAATPQRGCQRDTLKAMVNDHEVTAPYVLVTTTGRRLRAYGQDFINPNTWRSGDALEICADDTDKVALHVRNLRRGEDLVTENDRVTAGTLPLQIMNGPGFQALLALVDVQCPVSRVRFATPAALLDEDEVFEDSLDAPTSRRLRAEKHLAPSGDYSRCAGRDGASCPANEAMDALDRAGLLKRFAKVVCGHGGAPWG